MSRCLNLQLKEGIEPKELLKYGLEPKYDSDTGEIKKYVKKIQIRGEYQNEKHFTFVIYRDWRYKLFKRFEYTAWMTGFDWNDVARPECMQMLYDLIINGIVEPVEKVVEDNDR